jgi:hypothetical protein
MLRVSFTYGAMRRLMARGFACSCRYYLSIRGGSQCAYYSIRPRLVTGECVNEFDHDSALDSLDSVTRLQLGKLIGGTCQADSFLDYTFVISEDEARNNLLFQVEDLSVNDNPNSLIIHLVRTISCSPWRLPSLQLSIFRLRRAA